MVWLIGALIILAGIFKALADHEVRTNNVGRSWKNKWKLYAGGNPIENPHGHWYYFGLYKPKYQERFPYSSTILVAFTDKWHRYNGLKDWSLHLCIGLSFYRWTWKAILATIIIKMIQQVSFELLFTNLKRKK